MLTEFSNTQATKLCQSWKKFYQHLFMKYMDGNLNTVAPSQPNQKYTPINSDHPKYSDEYYRILIEKTGDKYKAY